MFTTSIAFSQSTSSISGFVREEATGEPISYANVFISNTEHGAATNQDGYFVIPKIPFGEIELNVSMIGYGVYREIITLEENSSIRLNIRLKEEAIQSEEIFVTAERQKFEQSMESSQISLNLREINSAPAFVEPDVFRTIQMLPGVQTTSDFSSALYVRGSTPDQNLIMLDGISVYNPYHLGGIFSTFNTDAIKEADFHAGGFPARYGGRMGAILNVINREGNTQKVKGFANISLISAKGLAEGPIPEFKGMKGSWMFSGRRTYFDRIVDAMKIPLNENEDGSKTYFTFPYFFYDYQIKMNLDFGMDHRLTYSRFYGDDVLDFSIDESSNYNYDENASSNRTSEFGIEWPWGNHTNGLTWRWIVSPVVVAKTFLSQSRYRFHFNMFADEKETITYIDSTVTNETKFSFNIFDIILDRTLESEIEWKLNESNKITAGFQLKQVDFDLGMDFNITTLDTSMTWTPLDMDSRTKEMAFFIQNKMDMSEKLKLQIGMRNTKYSLHDKLYVDPRLGVKYHWSDNLALKLNVGVYHQFLTTANNQDENLRLVDLWFGIPEDKDASRSTHAIIGMEYLSPKNIFFRIEAYQKEFDNLLTLKQADAYTENENEIQTDPFNEFWDTDATASGLELLIKKSSGRVNGWIGYTLARTKYYNPQSDWHYPNFDRTHTLNFVTNFEITSDLEFSASVSTSTGNPYTPIIGRVYSFSHKLDTETDWGTYDSFLVGDKNSVRYDNYVRFDIGLTRKHGNIFGLKYDTYWQVMNVTNHVNTLGYTYRNKYDPTGNQMGVERRKVGMFPLMLTFGVKFEL